MIRALLFLAAGLALAACTGSGGSTAPSDAEYGHRYEGLAPDGRETVLITPPDSAVSYVVTPAVLDSVLVRPARTAAAPGEAVPVEVLVKGALPDACSALNPPEQSRAANLVAVTLTMRRPRETACAQVVRPFRFYLPLEGTYPPGAYTLTLNGAAYPFRIRAAEPDSGS